MAFIPAANTFPLPHRLSDRQTEFALLALDCAASLVKRPPHATRPGVERVHQRVRLRQRQPARHARRVLKPLARGRVPTHDVAAFSRPRGIISEEKERRKILPRQLQKSTRQRRRQKKKGWDLAAGVAPARPRPYYVLTRLQASRCRAASGRMPKLPLSSPETSQAVGLVDVGVGRARGGAALPHGQQRARTRGARHTRRALELKKRRRRRPSRWRGRERR